MITIKDAIEFIKVISGEVYDNFLKMGVTGVDQIFRITPGFAIRFDYYPDKVLKQFSSMSKFYDVCTFNALYKADYFKRAGISSSVVKKELGITDQEWDFVKNTPGRDMSGKWINGSFVGHYIN